MPTKVKNADAEAVALAEAMLRELASLRQHGGAAYPPRLRQLAALAGGSPAEELVRKAAAKAALTSKAVVPEKADRKPSLDSPVYFKGDAPPKSKKPAPKRASAGAPKDDGSELAGRMIAVLEAQRRLGDGAYPPTLRRLAELCDLNGSDARVAKAAAHETVTDRAVVAAKSGAKPGPDAPVVLRDDLDGRFATVFPALLRFALSAVPAKGKTKESTAFTPAEVKGRFVLELQKPVSGALEQGIERNDLPVGVAWVFTKGKPYVFLVDNLRPAATRSPRQAINGTPAAPVPAGDFAGSFREAFGRLDRRNGGTNFVKLADLRHALGGFGRDAFDAGLRALRLGGEFSLDSHEGMHGSLTPDEREAGVREGGSLLVYASRR